ncbi:MAG: DUF305 domain-containing protein [Pseudonocardia sp.]
MTVPTGTDPETDVPAVDREVTARTPGWLRVLVAVGGALAIFLLGAATGLLVGLPGSGTATPEADSVDVGFSQDMTVHHEQAVQMASWARDHTTDPVIRTLAYDIESTQTAEIGRMQGWLTLWGAPQQPPGRYMRWMAGTTGHAGHGGGLGAVPPDGVATMPGMASPEELAALRAASGRDLDVMFLQLMLRHHEGGAPMLAYASQYATEPAVRSLAGQMATAQATEADYLRTLLAERGAQPLPF